MKHLLIFLILTSFAVAQSGRNFERRDPPAGTVVGQWYDCSHEDDYISPPENTFTHKHGWPQWYIDAKKICTVRGHAWWLEKKERGPVYGSPGGFVQDDSSKSVLVRVMLRDYKMFRCKRCKSTRTLIKWGVDCKLLWKREGP